MEMLTIYDSVFGNAEKIARAVAAALGTQAVPAGQVNAGQLLGLGLLVIGSPTPACGPRRALPGCSTGCLKIPWQTFV
ncbi:MAG: hypothetical protein ACOYYS_16080 [Chloroflexota bacterium]